jgi:hypothetical protein
MLAAVARTRSTLPRARPGEARRLLASASEGVKVKFDKPFLTYKLDTAPPEETIVRPHAACLPLPLCCFWLLCGFAAVRLSVPGVGALVHALVLLETSTARMLPHRRLCA